MMQYIVKTPLQHNGQHYEPETLIELSSTEAEKLLEDGVIAYAELTNHGLNEGSFMLKL
jgi:hypothetical protein